MLRSSTVRILYGVVGEGMGHATRSGVVIERLLQAGHEVRVVVSGRARRFLIERLRAYSGVSFTEINGFRLRYHRNRLDKSDSLLCALRNAPADIVQNARAYRQVTAGGFRPRLALSDFESWVGLYGLTHSLPVIRIDNLQIISRCRHEPQLAAPHSFMDVLARAAVRIKVPATAHFLIPSFFYPPVAKPCTTLVPPLLRRVIIEARREPGEHVLVYQTSSSNDALVPTLRTLPHRFRVYGMGREGREGNVELRAFSEQGFVDDLRTARAVIAGGGFSLMSEAVTLHVPMLSVPIEQQYEQGLNARYLAHLGFGAWSPHLDRDVMLDFLDRTDDYAERLATYERRDNEMFFGCLNEIFERCTTGDPHPALLASPAMAKWAPDGAL